jgi:cellulose synthase/poly-beta-1,6-N-acetylglucosamine synthase-like glycosyltransferase
VIALAALAVALLAYTYVGYPVAIGVLARLRPVVKKRRERNVGDDADLPRITICLPVYNGEAYLPKKLASLFAQDYPRDKLDVIVFCDGCTDGTEALARELAAQEAARGGVRVNVLVGHRKGKPTALNTMSAAATGDLILLNDVRQPLAPASARALARALDDPGVGCATGNLVLEGDAGSGVYWRYENWIRKQESRYRGMVGITGPIAMVRRSDLEPLPTDVILDDVWVPSRLALRGQRVELVEEAEARDAAFEDDREFKRKVRTLAGNYQIFSMLPGLLSPAKNPIWFETISHKILRLVAPWLLIALMLVSGVAFLTPGGSSALRALFLAQVAFYALAVAGRRAGRIAGVARTFVVLNVAALVGLFKFATGKQRITW